MQELDIVKNVHFANTTFIFIRSKTKPVVYFSDLGFNHHQSHTNVTANAVLDGLSGSSQGELKML